ncbi:MAG: hypothetical protein IAE66_08825 [Xanthomonadaceae bacterium]|mgnify:CR=1 FL=1|nr:hypothetical protein [Xanthomonadaceae bacterium]
MRIASPGRVAVIASLAAAVALTSGCGWFRKDNDAYKLSGEARPLEIPPPLDRPNTEGAMALPDGGASVMASSTNRAAQGVATPSGFNIAGAQRDEVFAKLADALAGVQGLTIASKAQLLGSYDVSYGGDNFLVRTAQTPNGVYVSAVDPRGMPDNRANPVAVIGQLKTALGGQ